jgi:hypothetical protein
MLFGKPNYRVISSGRRPSSFDYPKPPLQLPRETDPETKIADARASGWMTDQQSKCLLGHSRRSDGDCVTSRLLELERTCEFSPDGAEVQRDGLYFAVQVTGTGVITTRICR